VISGKDKGKTGKVSQAFPALKKVLIPGINVHKKHMKARRTGEKGQMVDMPGLVHVSNVMLVDDTNKRTRVTYKMVGDKKTRTAKTTKKAI